MVVFVDSEAAVNRTQLLVPLCWGIGLSQSRWHPIHQESWAFFLLHEAGVSVRRISRFGMFTVATGTAEQRHMHSS